MTMHGRLLQKCRDYLEESYRRKLGSGFSGSIDQLQTGRLPVWRIVSSEDLVSEVPPDSPSAAGLLLDPEIGLLLYLAPFSLETDIRRQILTALALRSRLSIEAVRDGDIPGSGEGDARGSWRVVLHWLVRSEDGDAWRQRVAEVRREQGFSEEISLDAILLRPEEGLESQLRRHGFPRLLLTTRELFRKQCPDDLTRWMSADDRVREALAGFPSRFEAGEQRELAQEVVDEMSKEAESSGKEAPPGQTWDFQAFRIRNFRNLRDFTLDFGSGPVSAEVICGANGTGKSSLCEALSIALFGSSSRYRAFVDRTGEKDVTATDRASEYLTRYLAPLDAGPEEIPRIAFDDEPLLPPELAPAGQAAEADRAMAGTVLPQGKGRDFALLSAQELGALILRGYSELAGRIEEYTDRRVGEANSRRRDFLASLGLSTSITRLNTALERIARREIDRSLPGLPHALLQWLEAVASGSELSLRWHDWGGDPSRNLLAARLAGSGEGAGAGLRSEMEAWLREFNQLAALSQEKVREIETRLGPIRGELETAAQRIKSWGEWLERNRAGSPAADSGDAKPLAERLQALLEEQQRVLDQGRSAARHLDHLTQTEAFLRESWTREHPDLCPTCGTEHSGQGGVLAVAETLRSRIADRRDELRREYGRLKGEIDELQGALNKSGRAQCPVPLNEQSRLAEALSWLLPARSEIAGFIAEAGQREELLAALEVLKQRPTVPGPVAVESEAERVAGELQWLFSDALRMFEEPGHWKPVKEALTAVLADVVNRHLPSTLAALWSELFLNLTAAPWLLPERPAMGVAIRRGEKRSTLQVKGRLARYILNQSETHVLGLGWFFACYLTHGRFSHSCLVMDDPAHEMDESTFRDFCRLLETLVRLHRVYGRPLKLVVMLHQESRAMEAARATGGALTMLGWDSEQKGRPPSVRVRPEGLYPPPVRLIRRVGG
jgi:hypothetical protein